MKTKRPSRTTRQDPLQEIGKALLEIREKLVKLEKEIDVTQKYLRVEIVTSALNIKQELGKKVQDLHNEELDKLDSIAKELEDMRQDKEIGAYQTAEIREDLTKLEKRIARLEKLQQAA